MLIPIIAADAADVFRLPLILGDRARARHSGYYLMFILSQDPVILHLPARILKLIPLVQWIRAMKRELRGRGDGFF